MTSSSNALRLFVALPLSEELRAELQSAQQQLLETEPQLKITAADQLHITLKFLGNTAEEQLEPLDTCLKHCATLIPPLKLQLGTLGAFPPGRPARIAWCSIETANSDLALLVDAIDEGLTQLGFVPEERKFHAHITLGRFKKFPSKSFAGNARSIVIEPVAQEAAEFVLYQSVLSAEGPEYKQLRSYELMKRR